VTVLAHNEERRIGACLDSLPLDDLGVAVHVVVNGSTDRTADIALSRAAPNLHIHVYEEGGKARSWGRFVRELPAFSPVHVFVDGDARVAPGSIEALAATLAEHPEANAASGLPLNGRGAEDYRQSIVDESGLFGDLYALRGTFLERMRSRGIRLPVDLVGDDGLIAALAHTDLGPNDAWQCARVAPCPGAGFYCEPVRLADPATWRMQYRRMISYSVRHFQNRIIIGVMEGPGPEGLPERLASLYPEWLPRFRARPDPRLWWFDRLALARMRAAV
jgi:glycosyltransferase involved in cell wall biosynthesis